MISRVSLVDRPRGGQDLLVTTDCVTVVLRSLDPIDTVGLTYLVEYAKPGVPGGICGILIIFLAAFRLQWTHDLWLFFILLYTKVLVATRGSGIPVD